MRHFTVQTDADGFARAQARLAAAPFDAEAAAELALHALRGRAPWRARPKAGAAARALLRSKMGAQAAGIYALRLRWQEIAGARLAALTSAKAITGAGAARCLEILTAPGAALAVQQQERALIAKINLVLGARAIAKLRLVQGPVKAPAPPLRSTATPTKLAPAQEQAIAVRLGAVQSPELAATLADMARLLKSRQVPQAPTRMA